jgi:hypothetical protein
LRFYLILPGFRPRPLKAKLISVVCDRSDLGSTIFAIEEKQAHKKRSCFSGRGEASEEISSRLSQFVTKLHSTYVIGRSLGRNPRQKAKKSPMAWDESYAFLIVRNQV